MRSKQKNIEFVKKKEMMVPRVCIIFFIFGVTNCSISSRDIVFEETSRVDVKSMRKNEYYYYTRYDTTVTVTKSSDTDIRTPNVDIHVPLPYSRLQYDLIINNKSVTPNEYRTTYFDSWLQICAFEAKSLPHNDSLWGSDNKLHITVKSLEADKLIRWRLMTKPEQNRMDYDLMFFLRVPINAVMLHGSRWTNAFYDWVFFVVCFLLSVFLIATKKSYQKIVPSLAIYACASYAASFSAKLYHVLLGYFAVTDKVSFAIFVLAIEFAAVLWSVLFITTYYRNPYLIGSLSLIASSGFVFLGTSYFAGNGLLGLSSLVLLFQNGCRAFQNAR